MSIQRALQAKGQASYEFLKNIFSIIFLILKIVNQSIFVVESPFDCWRMRNGHITGRVPLKAQQISKLHEKYIFQQNAFLSSEKDDFGSSLSFPGIDFDQLINLPHFQVDRSRVIFSLVPLKAQHTKYPLELD